MMKEIQPPVAHKKEVLLEKHSDLRRDCYFWLNERDTPQVMSYLHQENEYYNQQTAHTKTFQEELFQEMKSRIKEDDSSVPYFHNGYWYIKRFEVGKSYPIYSRKKMYLEAPEEILFDVNEMAEGHSYFKLSEVNVSPDNQWAIFAEDTLGRRLYSLKIKNLKTGEILSEVIRNTSGETAWANDSQTFFYVKKDKQTLRPDTVKRHCLHISPNRDELIFNELDEMFSLSVSTSKSDKYIFIESLSNTTSEYQYISADKPFSEFQIFQPRIPGVEYDVYHYEDMFYILHNASESFNFQLDKTPLTATSKTNWIPVIAHRQETLLEDIDIFEKYLVLSERTDGLTRIRIIGWDGKVDFYLPFESETYTAYTSTNMDFHTSKLRLVYESLATPVSVCEFDMSTRQMHILREQEVLGGFDKNRYEERRIWATADDGTQIPVSLVYQKGLQHSENTPLLLYGYGSYGVTVDPYFSSSRISLLDRGFIFAIAHIRGGAYLGRKWYESGKLFQKKNTFTDFINVAEHLIRQRYTSSQHLYAMGGSAGGLLMGVVVNWRPELFRAVVAQVPFVDVVNTMLDESLPLTVGEYEEWGNPNEKTDYDYIRSYSPYDNVTHQNYPNMLITSGYYDSQVQYWEPAKWVAKLREMKTDTNQLYLYTDMDSGHSGASGRFEALREVAREYAFLLDFERKKQE